MIRKLALAVTGLALTLGAGSALAAGELNIYNWGNYTNPKLIEKFEKETSIKVTITDYDSNDTALAKVKAGGHGFDIVVPPARPSKRATRLRVRLSPPTLSHGTQTLYEFPRLVLLWCVSS